MSLMPARWLLFLVCTQTIYISALHAQTLSHVLTVSSSENEKLFRHVRDQSGNTYVSFIVGGPGFGPVKVLGTSYTSYPSGSYVAKLDVGGAVVWQHEYGNILAMAIGPDQNLIITGSVNQYTYVVAKVNAVTGVKMWEVKQGTSGGMYGNDVIVDGSGDVYVTGLANSVSVFGVALATNCCPDHNFIMKVSASGSLVWFRAAGVDEYSAGNSLAFDAQGNIVTSGVHDFGFHLGSFALPGPGIGYHSTYLAGISPQGNVLWLKGFTSPNGHVEVTEITVDSDGAIYLAGGFSGSVSLDGFSLISKGSFDLFIAKLSPLHQTEWVVAGGSIQDDKADNILHTSDGIIASLVVSGDMTLGGMSLTGISGSESVIVKLDKNGNVQILKSIGKQQLLLPIPIYPRTGPDLIKITDKCLSVAGDFIGSLHTTEETFTAYGVVDSFLGTLSLPDEPIPDAGPDIGIDLCGVTESTVLLPDNQGLSSYWTLSSGTMPVITATGSTSALISNISPGITVLRYRLASCVASDENKITIKQVAKPSVPALQTNYLFCPATLPETEIKCTDTGTVRWYKDSALTNLTHEGNTYKPAITESLYVTQTVDNCPSNPLTVDVVIRAQPAPPQTTPSETCVSVPVILSAGGAGLRWYLTPDSPVALAASNIYKTKYDEAGQHTVYVSQTVNGCESEKSKIIVNVREFNSEEFKLSNVVTSNQDGLNECFMIPPYVTELCLGSFRRIVIFNRSSSQVFESGDRNFAWYPVDIPAGVYFYWLEFDQMKFKGWITVMH